MNLIKRFIGGGGVLLMWLGLAAAQTPQADPPCKDVLAQCTQPDKVVELRATVEQAAAATRLRVRRLDKVPDELELRCSGAAEAPPLRALVSARTTVVKGVRHVCPAAAAEAPVRVLGALIDARVAAVDDKGQAWLLLRPDPDAARPTPEDGTRPGIYRLAVIDSGLKPWIAQLAVGDHVQALFATDPPRDAAAPGVAGTVLQIDWRVAQQGYGAAAVWLAIGLAAVALVAWLFTGGRPYHLWLGEDGRYSTSKFQAALWFWLVFAGYLVALVSRCWHMGIDFIGGVAIPQNLIILSGISVLTVASAKAITTGKVEAAAPAAAALGTTPKPPATDKRPGDLIRDDFRRIDLGDFQSVLVTLIACGVYAAILVRHLALIEFRQNVALPDLDATLLALFGLSQAGYLGKKAAGDVGAGLTPQQAAGRGAELAKAARLAAEQAEQASRVATAERGKARSNLDAVNLAATQSQALPRQAEAAAAAALVQSARDRCAALQQDAAASLQALEKLAVDWGSDPATKALVQQAMEEAKRSRDRIAAVLTEITALATDAQADADAAYQAASAKNP